jgi:membrane-associated phospholipid phosphatase
MLAWRRGLLAANPKTPPWVAQLQPENLYFAFGGEGEGVIWALRAWCEATCVTAVCVAVLLLETGRRRLVVPAALLLSLGLGVGAAQALKPLVPRTRPIAFAGTDPWPASWGAVEGQTRYQRVSFPSSHAAAALATSSALIRAYPPLVWLLLPLGLAAASTRFLTLSHWPTDILVGAALGWFGGAVAWRLVRGFVDQPDAVQHTEPPKNHA